ncbi:APC family permease [Paenibacillus tyrfis]|uniref:Amino acid permease n=1 Tax=Paenibacillus tyrfis TaxID=1501230 RepID=A0A081NX80_9BACL|nr:amino acid permease [Paenibacillus tyrfis]KEQ23053.1 amino acid permease [Paenibacillus tyrfis]
MTKRTITMAQGVALYMGAVLGSGILILPGYTADAAGPAAIISWLLLSLLSVPIAYTFARLALKYENYGGIATIVQQAFGEKSGAVVGWFFFAWVATGQAVVGLTGASYIVTVFGLAGEWLYGFAFLFLVAALAANLLGMRISGLVSLGLSGIVLVLLVLTIAFSLPAIDAVHFRPFAPHGLTGIGQACVLIFWAFFGWESITHLVPEFRNPQRDVMRCTWASVFIIGAVYTLLSAVTIGTHTYGDIGTEAPLAALMNRALGLNAGLATVVVACIVCLGTLNVYLASSSRLGYALAVEGKLPQWFAKSSRSGTPYRSVFFLFVTNTLTLAFSYTASFSVDRLILVPTTLGILVYIVASFACVKLLWSDKAGRLAALTSSALCLAIAPFSMQYLAVPAVVAASCLLYLRYRRKLQP